MKKSFVTIALLFAVFLFQGCGRKGPPVAPEESVYGKSIPAVFSPKIHHK